MTVYYVCKYTPLELIAGCGAEYAALDPLAERFSCAESCAHANLCGYGKAVLEQVAGGGVKALVLTNCCDTMRRVYDVLKNRNTLDFLAFLPLPHQNTAPARARFAADLASFAAALTARTGRPFDPARAAAHFIERTRAPGPHLVLAGAHGGSVLYHAAAREFSLPVADETCFAGRRVAKPAGEPADLAAFLPPYAAALLAQTPCMRMQEQEQARAALFDPDTRGVIWHTVQFCDYYGLGFAQPPAELPLLTIETDCTRQPFEGAGGQLHTRLAAFAESLNAAPRTARPAAAVPGAGYAAGIDSGSASTDAVILDRGGRLAGWAIVPTGAGAAAGARLALAQALEKAGLTAKDLAAQVYTGYGREYIGETGGETVTEITCHARGAHFLDPGVRTVVDIGGQDSKVIRLSENGAVESFVMNDKCAAGTGRFLEMMARTLQLPLADMAALGLAWKNDVSISSMCTVFAESEVVSLIARSTPPADIIHGLNKAVAGKTAALVRRAGGSGPFLMTGGVARNPGVVAELEKALGAPVAVSEYSQLCGSIGAALFALDRLRG